MSDFKSNFDKERERVMDIKERILSKEQYKTQSIIEMKQKLNELQRV